MSESELFNVKIRIHDPERSKQTKTYRFKSFHNTLDIIIDLFLESLIVRINRANDEQQAVLVLIERLQIKI